MNFFRKTKKGFLFSIMAIFIVVLSACGGNEDKTEEASTEPVETEETSYTVNHAMGETIIPETPERIVILTNEGTEALLALGVKPVGAVQSWLGDPWYEHIASQMEDVVNLGTEIEPSIEEIIALEPDLIIGTKVRQEQVYEQLSAIAPTIFSETLKGEWQENFNLYAEALNKKDEGQEVIAQFNQRTEVFKQKAGDQLEKEVSVVRFLPGTARIYHKQSFSGVVLDQLGIKRPAVQDVDDFMIEVSKESIPNMDGDLLFYFTYDDGSGLGTQTKEEWLNDPLWNNLDVINDGNVHEVSDAIWNTAGGVLAANIMLDELFQIYEIE
ncbi:ABC transporter substrate-binding protein [Chengkuizengella marina]|uniref:Iron-siderophore ABC transporter substrate-binding protein n=1 Tax=Chengkuizengella marina TaxID=2507566 RepID=A0A6N9Q566_9BACL|nr:iron-siderophore ABC transporter substrate-binding protein [Chengkuizengella marina]NBI29891.1 iron-siderophore ABC transporter substrate-binding protein [Chengkuizengella marina]